MSTSDGRRRRSALRKSWVGEFALLGFISVIGCSAAPNAESTARMSRGMMANGAVPPPANAAGVFSDAAMIPSESPSPETKSSSHGGSTTRLMIYSARYELLVGNVDDAVSRFLDWVEGEGGYLESRSDGDVTCRVPVDRFFGLVERVPSLGRVLSEKMDAQDVTRQVRDLDLRIEVAQESRRRLLELLARATDTKAILEIEKEVRRLNEEIEGMTGEVNWLRQQIALSTLQVVFRANAPSISDVGPRQRSRFPWINAIGVDRMLEAF